MTSAIPIRIVAVVALIGGALAADDQAASSVKPEAITYGQTVDIPMPAAFHIFAARLVDWTGDGLIDVLASPATGGAVYLLRNIGTGREPRFEYPFEQPPLVGAARGRWTLFDSIEEEHAAPERAASLDDLSASIGRTFDVADLEGDGDQDLLVSRGGRMVWLRNAGTTEAPVWASPLEVADESGSPVRFRDFWYTVNPEAVDWDGDGRLDILCGVWHPSRYVSGDIRIVRPREAYASLGAHIYWLRNVGTPGSPRYAAPVALAADDGVLAGLGIPATRSVDWDGDGDLDLLVAYYDASVRYYENVGVRAHPRLVDRGRLEADGQPIASAQVFRPDPAAADLDGDGDLDLVLAGHGRAVMWFENAGTRREPSLVWRGALPVRATPQTPLHLGNIITPVTFDVDGDGDRDLLAGNEPGVFLWAENIGSNARPIFGPAQPLQGTDGQVVELFSRDLGMSMWGPLEDWDERTSPVPVDWDGDGRWDIVTNTMSGRVYWLRNAGSARAPRFDSPRPVSGPSGELRSLPRSRPGLADWNRDGVPDLVLPDERGILTVFIGARTAGGEPRPVRLAQIVHPLSPAGEPIVIHPALDDVTAGRVQHEVVDWDADGRVDILVSRRTDTTPRRYVIAWLRNTGSSDAAVLEERELIHSVASGHEAGLHVVDWDLDGTLDVLTGDQEGRVWFWDGRHLDRGTADHRDAAHAPAEAR